VGWEEFHCLVKASDGIVVLPEPVESEATEEPGICRERYLCDDLFRVLRCVPEEAEPVKGNRKREAGIRIIGILLKLFLKVRDCF
jgi:hypothetical protein